MERLLTRNEVAWRLGMAVRTFSRHRARLVAEGLQVVKIGKHPKYRQSSLDKLIKRVAETEVSICGLAQTISTEKPQQILLQLEKHLAKFSRRKKDSGYIYLLKSNNLYKIGTTKEPTKRLNAYTTENPFPTETIICDLILGYKAIERAVTNQFKLQVRRGYEWLELSKSDIEAITSFVSKYRLVLS